MLLNTPTFNGFVAYGSLRFTGNSKETTASDFQGEALVGTVSPAALRGNQLSPEAQLITLTAIEAGILARNIRARGLVSKSKVETLPDGSTYTSLATDADAAAEALIARKLGAQGYDIHGEEGGDAAGAIPSGIPKRGKFYVDPVDGTGSFAEGKAWYGVSIGREQGPSVVFLPDTGQLFLTDGNGAYAARLPVAPAGDNTAPIPTLQSLQLNRLTLSTTPALPSQTQMMELGWFSPDPNLEIRQAFANGFLKALKDKNLNAAVYYNRCTVTAALHTAMGQTIENGKIEGYPVAFPYQVEGGKIAPIYQKDGEPWMFLSPNEIRSGKVIAQVQVNLNPWDVMAVKDILEKAGVYCAALNVPGFPDRVGFISAQDKDIFETLKILYGKLILKNISS